jgi:hypothetical protein
VIDYTHEESKVGQAMRLEYIYDESLNVHRKITIFVIREATKEEYIEEHKNNPNLNLKLLDEPGLFFYEFTMD